MGVDVQEASELVERDTDSGELVLQVTPALYAQLAATAEAEGVDLNALIVGMLAGAVRWRAQAGIDATPPTPRWARRTLALNVAVLTILAVLATALVVVALVNV